MSALNLDTLDQLGGTRDPEISIGMYKWRLQVLTHLPPIDNIATEIMII